MRIALLAGFVLLPLGLLAEPPSFERSFWLHASLAADTRLGYWGTNYPAAIPATEAEIGRAAHWLTKTAAANRLYLVHHRECPLPVAREVFASWRRQVDSRIELVPTLVLRSYDRDATTVFPAGELEALASFCRDRIGPLMAVYDVHGGRDQGGSLTTLAGVFTNGLIRVGIQPDEVLAAPFVHAVADTWSAFCHGRTNERWEKDAAGLPTLRAWVAARRNGGGTFAWDLIAVAWDYSTTEDGRYPGYDDAARNLPLPECRNTRAALEIRGAAAAGTFAGYSSDLCIVEANAKHAARDGVTNSLYACLRKGTDYRGAFAKPLDEIAGLYRSWRDATLKASPP